MTPGLGTALVRGPSARHNHSAVQTGWLSTGGWYARQGSNLRPFAPELSELPLASSSVPWIFNNLGRLPSLSRQPESLHSGAFGYGSDTVLHKLRSTRSPPIPPHRPMEHRIDLVRPGGDGPSLACLISFHGVRDADRIAV